MGKFGNRTDANVYLVPDDAHIVRYAELADLLEELGTIGMVARHLDVATATISRHLLRAGIPVGKEFVGRMATEIERLETKHADDVEKMAKQESRIAELENRG